MRRIIVVYFLLLCLGAKAQEKVYVNAFKNKQLINAQTAVIPEGFDFTIMHRFGKIGLDVIFFYLKTYRIKSLFLILMPFL